MPGRRGRSCCPRRQRVLSFLQSQWADAVRETWPGAGARLRGRAAPSDSQAAQVGPGVLGGTTGGSEGQGPQV